MCFQGNRLEAETSLPILQLTLNEVALELEEVAGLHVILAFAGTSEHRCVVGSAQWQDG